MTATRTTRTGARLPILGLGTWEMGEERVLRKEEVRALQLGIDLGMKLVDTAEMYADGGVDRGFARRVAFSGMTLETRKTSSRRPCKASPTTSSARRGVLPPCPRYAA